jgi:hypothetical protein
MTGIIEFKSDTLNVEVSGVDNNLTNLIEVIPSKSDVIVNIDNVNSSLYINNVEVSGADNGTVNIVEITPDDQDVYINVQDTSTVIPDLSNYYTRDNPSGFITGINVDLSNYATDSQLSQTGSNLQSQINNLYNSGFITGVDLSSYATISNLQLTGQNLQNQINNIDITSQLTGVSGYFQNQFDNLDLNYASDSQLSQTGITLLNAISQSSGINGSVYIIDINPSGGIGNIGDKVYEDIGGTSSNSILNSCSTTTQNVVVSVLALPGHTRYKPAVTLSGQNVTLTALADRPLFTGAAFINLNSGTSLTVRHQDGASHTCAIAQDLPPVVQVAYFTGGYPGTQTELKENDTFNFFIQTNTAITRIEIDNYGAYKSFSANVTAGTSFTVTTAQAANRGTSTQNLGARVRVQKANGSFSNWYLTESFGSTDGTHLIKLNNTYPTISTINQANIAYPASQAALKDSETAVVNHTVTNANTVIYNSPNGELSISNSSTYEAAKIVQRIGGTYNISTNNFRIVATRTANNAVTTTTSTVVYIAHTAPTLSVTTPFTRLRSGGNNGTSVQSYNIVITASQNLISAPSLTPDTNNGGTFSGTGFAGGPTVWTRALQVNDNLVKGTKTWASISGTNLAGKAVTTITSGGTYTIAGFVSRTLSLAAFANEVTLNTSVVDFSKMTLSWAVKALPNKAIVGINVPPPQPDTWTINALNANPTTVRILDTSATNSSSAASNVIVEETV